MKKKISIARIIIDNANSDSILKKPFCALIKTIAPIKIGI
jgi:hypothetical protein